MEAIYCLCGQPYDYNKFMIQCDICKDWFHGRYIAYCFNFYVLCCIIYSDWNVVNVCEAYNPEYFISRNVL
jgi:hypothetical protein